MNESARSRTVKSSLENPELTIAAGLLALGAAVYAVEAYLVPSLLLDGGNPATLAAVFGAFALVYLVAFALLRHTPPIAEQRL